MNTLLGDASNVLAQRNLSSPVQSLLWKCWRLSRTKFVLQILITVGILALMVFFMDPTMTFGDRSKILTGMAVMSSVSLYFSCFGLSYRPTRSPFENFGFPFFSDFGYPVSTLLLIAVPLIYLCAMIAISFVAPLWLLSFFVDIASPQPVLIIIILEALLVVTALTWMTTSATLQYAVYLPLGLMIWYTKWLFPEFEVIQETNEFVIESPAVFALPLLFTAALLVLMYIGVHRDRRGDSLFDIDMPDLKKNEDVDMRDFFPFLQFKCPTSSPLRAEIWREMQTRGLHSALCYGLALGCGVLLMMVFIVTRGLGTGAGSAQLNQVVNLSLISFSVVSLVYLSKVYGATTVNGQVQIGVFDRTRALGTVQLVSIKIVNAILGLLVMTLTMSLIIATFGGFIVDNMAEMRAGAWDFMLFLFSWPIADTLYYGLLLFTQLCVGIVFYASFSVWCMLRPKVIGGVWFCLTAYSLALWVAALVLAEQGGIGALFVSYLTQSLWLIVVAIPAAIAYLMHTLLRDCVLTRMQMCSLVVVCLTIGVMIFQTLTQFGEPVAEISLLAKSLARVVCLLPLTAALLAPWTMSWVRHR